MSSYTKWSADIQLCNISGIVVKRSTGFMDWLKLLEHISDLTNCILASENKIQA